MADVALFQRYPQAVGRIPHVPLCALPTPVEPLEVGRHTWIKRDDISATIYGGNKVRKLEFLIAEATTQQRRQVLAFGYAGSNFATATAIFAREVGLGSASMLLPQEVEPYVERNLRVSHAVGADLCLASSVPTVALAAMRYSLRQFLAGNGRTRWIPAGGSSPLGVLGFVNAGFELLDQVANGELPPPSRIYLPVGSMGSVAGLALAFALAETPVTIVAVRVIGEEFASQEKLIRLIGQSARFLARRVPETRADEVDWGSFVSIDWRDEHFGEGYGVVTPACAAAVDAMRGAAGLPLDTTYSGKAFGCLIADEAQRRDDDPWLFWNTHNSRPLDAWLAGVEASDLPDPIQRYLARGR